VNTGVHAYILKGTHEHTFVRPFSYFVPSSQWIRSQDFEGSAVQ